MLKRCFAAFLSAAALIGPAAAQDLLVEDVTLIDGTGRPPIEDAWVLVKDGRIVRIARSPLTAESVERLDGRGNYLIPGLMDAHIHLRGARRLTPEGLQEVAPDFEEGIGALHSFLYAGVTSVYDAGNDADFILELRRRERTGEITAPRIFATGSIVTYPGSHGSGAAVLVDDWPEAKQTLDAHIESKPDLLKLTYEERGWGARPMIPKLPLPLMEKIIEYYNERGIRTTVHTASEYRARQAIFAGIDSLAHPVITGPITDAFAKLMAAKRIPMATTLTIGENYSRLAEHPEYLDQSLYRASLSQQEIEKLKGEQRREYEARTWTWWMKLMTPIAQENLRKIHEAGGSLALGTDQSLGPAVHREMELLVDAGIPPLEVISIASQGGARFLGKEEELGSIEEGKVADMVLLGGNPTADIDNAKMIETVIKAGRIIDRESLSLPIKPPAD